MWHDLKKSKLFILAVLVTLGLVLGYWGREMYKKYLIEQEIKGLEKEISLTQSKNTELLQLLNYFKTPEYKERQARSLLNLQKPGEYAVALQNSNDDQSESSHQDLPAPKISNLKLWWQYFFGK